VPPAVIDYGDLARMTEAMHPKLAMSAVSDLSFSSGAGVQGVTASSPAGGAGGGPQPGLAGHAGTTHGAAPVGGTSGGGGGQTLPFTGFAAGVAAAMGSALVAGGTALRRRLRRR
jgi:hypothetical protein